jgi:hypothetical protein
MRELATILLVCEIIAQVVNEPIQLMENERRTSCEESTP